MSNESNTRTKVSCDRTQREGGSMSASSQETSRREMLILFGLTQVQIAEMTTGDHNTVTLSINHGSHGCSFTVSVFRGDSVESASAYEFWSVGRNSTEIGRLVAMIPSIKA